MPVPPEPELRSGRYQVVSGEGSSRALERALRADAALLWQRNDGGAGLSVRIEPAVWRNGALGCPLSDRLYSPAPVPGWRAVVRNGPHALTYHASDDGRWLLCPEGRAEAPVATR